MRLNAPPPHPRSRTCHATQKNLRVKKRFVVSPASGILKYYADGVEQHSFPHQDKAEGVAGASASKCDMARDASFYVFSFGFAREFTIQRGNGVPEPKKDQKQLAKDDIVWQKALASGSLLKVAAADNRELFHALHKMPGAGERWSLIFRVIKSFIPIDAATASEVNDLALYRFVSLAQVKAGTGSRPAWPELEARIRTQASFTTAPQRRELRAREAGR